MNKILDDFKGWSKYEIAYTIFALSIVLVCGLYTGDTFLSILSALTNVMCVILVTKGKISNYIFGVIGVVLYAYMAFINRIYGDFMLNAFYYFPMQFIGMYLWVRSRKVSEDEQTTSVTVKKLSTKELISVVCLSIVLIYVYSWILARLGGQVPYLDATSTVLSVVAMILMALRYREQWLGWNIVNIVSVIMWYTAETTNYAQLFMWIVFLMNSLLGLYKWYYGDKKNTSNEDGNHKNGCNCDGDCGPDCKCKG